MTPLPARCRCFAVDNMLRNGPQSQGGTPIFANGMTAEPLGCQITVPGCQLSECQQEEASNTTFTTSLPTCDPSSANFAGGGNCVVGRATLALFGDGLVEAVDDQALIELAQNEPQSVQGVVKMVTENFLSTAHVGRFGWKDDHAFLRGFAGDAYLNEMGITNPDNPSDISSCALGVTQFGVTLEDTGIEDSTGPDGRADIDRFSDFHAGARAAADDSAKFVLIGGPGAVLAVGMRRVPCAVVDHRLQPRIVHPAVDRRHADELEGQQSPGEADIPSVRRFPVA